MQQKPDQLHYYMYDQQLTLASGDGGRGVGITAWTSVSLPARSRLTGALRSVVVEFSRSRVSDDCMVLGEREWGVCWDTVGWIDSTGPAKLIIYSSKSVTAKVSTYTSQKRALIWKIRRHVPSTSTVGIIHIMSAQCPWSTEWSDLPIQMTNFLWSTLTYLLATLTRDYQKDFYRATNTFHLGNSSLILHIVLRRGLTLHHGCSGGIMWRQRIWNLHTYTKPATHVRPSTCLKRVAKMAAPPGQGNSCLFVTTDYDISVLITCVYL